MRWRILALLFFPLAALGIPQVVSVPKSGGHLALKMLSLFPNPPNVEWADHTVSYGSRNPFQHEGDDQTILILRDLRDVFISLVYWFDCQIKEGQIGKHLASKHQGLRQRILHWRSCTFEDKLRIVLEDGADSLYYDGFMRENLEQALKLMKRPMVQVIRFEEMVGPKGGGSLKAQKEAIRKMSRLVSTEIQEKLVEKIADNLFGNQVENGESRTFRKGQIGSWKGKYSEKNLLIFYMRYGRYQKAFGYSA